MSAVPSQLPAANDPGDADAVETREWLDALEALIDREGPERAHFILERMIDLARRNGAFIPFSAHTAYINTIPTDLIERMCIEAALELTGDNRASAAELLGLSRQSLYIKLRRFGIGDVGAEPLPEGADADADGKGANAT